MTFSARCPNCNRKVYLGDEDTPICPVCSGPLTPAVNDLDDGKEAIED
jgi:rRNA maturation endonuclease Nob1